MNFIRNNFANALTLANLFSGTIGVVQLILGNYDSASICLLASLILDFFDGFVARALKANSELGGQLDSLADMVSFGVFPGIVMYKALEPFGYEILGIYLPFEIKYFAFLITVFSCLRLAIFNLDDDQKYYFKGLNTPTNTVFILGLFYLINPTFDLFQQPISKWALSPEILVLITFISSYLLVSPIKMIAMKFKSKELKDNYPKIALLIGAILLLAVFQMKAIALLVIYYIFISLVFQKQLSK